MTEGEQAIELLRAIAQAYYADGCVWGAAGVGEDDARRFMRAYESLMGASSPELQTVMLRPRSPHMHYTLEIP